MINETGTPGSESSMLNLQGNVRLLFSRIALGTVAPLIPTATLNNAYGHLPSNITQDYWRAITL
jgi:hypothetical protein